ncbi:MAG: MoaD/ThiS family protein [Ignavibacteria bacterium]|nr:MoaD/ThiS family protein [Ignavibacteria bacterium]
MEINILTFGHITDITSKAEFRISEVKDTDELRIKLSELFSAIRSIKYSIAVNKKVIQSNTVLTNDDTVALLPPFSGG